MLQKYYKCVSTLHTPAINSIFLSLFFVFAILDPISTEHIKSSVAPITTTTTTVRPIPHSSGLSLPMPNIHPPKCMREVPAIFSQYEKDVPIVGNSTTNPALNVIEDCCKGYKRYVYDWSKCVPDCGNKCQRNGFCLPDGICQCFDEFVLNHRNDCVPTCPLGCPHGRCYLNGTAVCDKGYELDPSKKYCMPYCEFGCGHNEVCHEPNNCECAEGYARSVGPEAKMGCQPICIPECGFGHCVAPNQCECFFGYLKRTNGSTCESSCNYLLCENGFCANRNKCVCQNGYKYDDKTTSCLPDCGDDCENGICLSPGVCRCFNGYQRNGAKCEAICEGGCGFYGKCIAPNICGCAIIDGPFDTFQSCESGDCGAKGRCRCERGTMRFMNQCLQPDKVTTYATMYHNKLNATLLHEFDLLIGRHFVLRHDLGKYFN